MRLPRDIEIDLRRWWAAQMLDRATEQLRQARLVANKRSGRSGELKAAAKANRRLADLMMCCPHAPADDCRCFRTPYTTKEPFKP